jgi:hypothetical protein
MPSHHLWQLTFDGPLDPPVASSGLPVVRKNASAIRCGPLPSPRLSSAIACLMDRPRLRSSEARCDRLHSRGRGRPAPRLQGTGEWSRMHGVPQGYGECARARPVRKLCNIGRYGAGYGPDREARIAAGYVDLRQRQRRPNRGLQAAVSWVDDRQFCSQSVGPGDFGETSYFEGNLRQRRPEWYKTFLLTNDL